MEGIKSELKMDKPPSFFLTSGLNVFGVISTYSVFCLPCFILNSDS